MKLLTRAAGAVVLAALLVTCGTVFRVWQVARQDHRPASDALVVLGASQYDGTPSAIFRARLAHTLDLFAEDVAPRIVTVGGSQAGDRFTEASAGAQWLIDHGVPSGNIVAVEEGGDTLQSMRAVARLFEEQGWRSAVLVTDPWHVLRSEQMARDEGIDAVASPTRQGPAVRTRESELRYILRESAAYLFYRIFDTSVERGPAAA